METVLNDLVVVVVVLLTFGFALLIEPLLLFGVLKIMDRGARRSRLDARIAKLQERVDELKRSTQAS